MKKSLLFLTLVTFITALTFTACTEKEIVNPETITEEVTAEATETPEDLTEFSAKLAKKKTARLLLPKQYNKADQKTIQKYVLTLSDSEIEAREESYYVYAYLASTKQLDKLLSDNPNFDILSKDDIANYAPGQMTQFEIFKVNETELFCVTLFEECLLNIFTIKAELCCYATISIPPSFECRVSVKIEIGC